VPLYCFEFLSALDTVGWVKPVPLIHNRSLPEQMAQESCVTNNVADTVTISDTAGELFLKCYSYS